MKFSPKAKLLALPLLLIVAVAAAARSASPRMDGEYGLWVEDRRDSLVVHWITRAATAGSLDLATDANVRQSFKTAAARAHSVAVKRPRGRQVTLVYGAADDQAERDTTVVYLQLGPRVNTVSNVDSLYIMGDTHGEYDNFLLTLRNAKLIDENHRWIGGRKQLALAGDLMDRGEDVTRLLWFVYGLEREAAAAGGRVHTVLGNHETMVWMRDLRYVPGKETGIAQTYGVPYTRMFDIRESVLGRWLISKPAVLKVNDVLIAHGGVSVDYLDFNTKTLDDTLSKYVGEELFYRWNDSLVVKIKIDSASFARRADFFMGPNSVFWYREYVTSATLEPQLDRVLRRFGATVHAVGHTPTTLVHQKYNGKLIAAHPRTPATELVLLVREGKTYKRLRIDQHGNVTTLPST